MCMACVLMCLCVAVFRHTNMHHVCTHAWYRKMFIVDVLYGIEMFYVIFY